LLLYSIDIQYFKKYILDQFQDFNNYLFNWWQ